MNAPAATTPGTVGWAGIDELHLEFEQCIAELRLAGDAMLARALGSLEVHLQRHFGAEERWMAEAGYPVLGCHKREHDMVFEVLAEVRRRVVAGDFDPGRRLVDELPRWFEVHVASHDSALAQFLRDTEAAARLTEV